MLAVGIFCKEFYFVFLENKVLSTSGLLDNIPEEYLTYKERYQNTIRKVVLMYKTLEAVEDRTKTFEEKIR